MKLQSSEHYYVYIVTNEAKAELICGVTGDLSLRMYQYEQAIRKANHATNPEGCRYLVWWEHFTEVNKARRREAEVRQYSMKKKKELIEISNPDWTFLNEKIGKEMKMFL